MSTNKKRKSTPPQKIVSELVPKDSPWTQADWWTEQSGTCKPIIKAICKSLLTGTLVLETETSPAAKERSAKSDDSPSGVDAFPASGTEAQAEDAPPAIVFDRGYVQQIPSTKGDEGMFGLFHGAWGKVLTRSDPWGVTVGHKDRVRSAHRKHTIRKPDGLFAKHASSCIATLHHIDDEKQRKQDATTNTGKKSSEQRVVPVQRAARHLKVADFQCVLMKARNKVKNRRGQVQTLKLELANEESADILPVIRVIVDDENGEIFVDDCVEVLDALIGFAGVLAGTEAFSLGEHEDDEEKDNEKDEVKEEEIHEEKEDKKHKEEEDKKHGEKEHEKHGEKEVEKDAGKEDEKDEEKQVGGTGWKIDHEICGDVDELTKDWLASNKATAQSFVSLCLQNTIPDTPAKSKRTAVRSPTETVTGPPKIITTRKRRIVAEID